MGHKYELSKLTTNWQQSSAHEYIDLGGRFMSHDRDEPVRATWK
jgi:hypothetical protein